MNPEDLMDEFASLYERIWARDVLLDDPNPKVSTLRANHLSEMIFSGIPQMELRAYVHDNIGGGEALFVGKRNWLYSLYYLKCRNQPNRFLFYNGNLDDVVEDLITAKLSL